jgi:hypothetical protein
MAVNGICNRFPAREKEVGTRVFSTQIGGPIKTLQSSTSANVQERKCFPYMEGLHSLEFFVLYQKLVQNPP